MTKFRVHWETAGDRGSSVVEAGSPAEAAALVRKQRPPGCRVTKTKVISSGAS